MSRNVRRTRTCGGTSRITPKGDVEDRYTPGGMLVAASVPLAGMDAHHESATQRSEEEDP